VKVKSESSVSAGRLELTVLGLYTGEGVASAANGLLARLAEKPYPTGVVTGLVGLAGTRLAGAGKGVMV
jgi:hypothetical protein